MYTLDTHRNDAVDVFRHLQRHVYIRYELLALAPQRLQPLEHEQIRIHEALDAVGRASGLALVQRAACDLAGHALAPADVREAVHRCGVSAAALVAGNSRWASVRGVGLPFWIRAFCVSPATNCCSSVLSAADRFVRLDASILPELGACRSADLLSGASTAGTRRRRRVVSRAGSGLAKIVSVVPYVRVRNVKWQLKLLGAAGRIALPLLCGCCPRIALQLELVLTMTSLRDRLFPDARCCHGPEPRRQQTARPRYIVGRHGFFSRAKVWC